MKFSRCPRCECKSLEQLKTYSVCYNCNFNTVEGFSWSSQGDDPHNQPTKGEREQIENKSRSKSQGVRADTKPFRKIS